MVAMAAGSKSTIAAIDMTRFACALFVVLHHYAAMFALAPESALHRIAPDVVLPRDWASWALPGWVGVELFFVISGYVIAISATGGGAGAFLRRRAFRLLPAGWICATITALVLAVATASDRLHLTIRWATSMLFWPFWPQVDGSYWTLGIEIAFYLLIATQLRAGRDNRAVVERIGLVLAIAGGGYWTARAAGMLGAADRLTDLLLFPHGGLFAIGIALSGWHACGKSAVRGAALMLGLASGVAEIVANDAFYARGLGLAASPGWPLAIFACGVIVIAAAVRLQPALARVPGIGLAGRMTYPLYLIHQEVGAVLLAALRRAGVGGHGAIVIAVAAMLVLAWAITRWAEPGVRAALAGWLSRRGPRPDNRRSASLPAG